MRYLFLLLLIHFSISCTEKSSTARLVNEWNGKVLLYPPDVTFSVLGEKKVNYLLTLGDFSIVTYADSVGCLECKLQLKKWKNFINELDSLTAPSIGVHFFLHPKNEKNMIQVLKDNRFFYPVCIDMQDKMNKLNKFPHEMKFQTFLIDKNNRVVAIGNPIYNPQVKDLYIKIILGDKSPKGEEKTQTTVACSTSIIDIGTFSWLQVQKVNFILKNTGSNLLVITDVIASCGCTSVEYNKEPVRSGGSVELEVNYEADHPERFNKTITVHCNAEASPMIFTIRGVAE